MQILLKLKFVLLVVLTAVLCAAPFVASHYQEEMSTRHNQARAQHVRFDGAFSQLYQSVLLYMVDEDPLSITAVNGNLNNIDAMIQKSAFTEQELQYFYRNMKLYQTLFADMMDATKKRQSVIQQSLRDRLSDLHLSLTSKVKDAAYIAQSKLDEEAVSFQQIQLIVFSLLILLVSLTLVWLFWGVNRTLQLHTIEVQDTKDVNEEVELDSSSQELTSNEPEEVETDNAPELIPAAAENDDEVESVDVSLETLSASKPETIMSAQAGSNLNWLPVPMLLTDELSKITYINHAFAEYSGYTEQELLGRNANFMFAEKASAQFFKQMWGQLRGQGSWQGNVAHKRKDGSVSHERLCIKDLSGLDGQTKRFSRTYIDINAQHNLQQAIKHYANFDQLTKLPNRSHFWQKLDGAINMHSHHGKQLSVLLISIDNFAHVNESLGHDAGDSLLMILKKRLQGLLQTKYTLARVGGSKFAILMPNMSRATSIKTLMSHVFKHLQRAVSVDDIDIYPQITAGACIFPDHGTDATTVMQNLESAAQKAKESGAGSLHLYTQTMQKQALRKLRMSALLREAIHNDEMFVVYQPKQNIATGRVTSVEALLRWTNDELGMVLPEEFIPLAEEMDLISEIGAWVLKQACQQNKEWLDSGLPPVLMSVNVSPKQFDNRQIMKDVHSALSSTKLPPKLLELEITESCLVENLDEVAAMLHQLRQIGMSISMDDFGTGYSSLSYLTKIPVNTIKIDGSFMHGLPDNKSDVALVSAIISLSHSLRCRVIAEGVEHKRQLDSLKKMKCDQIQGHFFSRPIDGALIPDLLVDSIHLDVI